MDDDEFEAYAQSGIRETMGIVLRNLRRAEADKAQAVNAERAAIVKFLRDFDPILAHAIDTLEHHKED